MNNALVVIDLINDIVSKNGKIPTCADQVLQRDIIAHCNAAIEKAKMNNWLVIFVKVGFDKLYHQQPKKSPIFGKADQYQALSLTDTGTEFHPELKVNENDCIIVKHRISPFYGTSLELTLRNHEITNLYICGVSTSWAIQSMVREGHDRDFMMNIIEDACASHSLDDHQQGIQQLSRIAKILKSTDL